MLMCPLTDEGTTPEPRGITIREFGSMNFLEDPPLRGDDEVVMIVVPAEEEPVLVEEHHDRRRAALVDEIPVESRVSVMLLDRDFHTSPQNRLEQG